MFMCDFAMLCSADNFYEMDSLWVLDMDRDTDMDMDADTDMLRDTDKDMNIQSLVS
jgi:hypothetical protein